MKTTEHVSKLTSIKDELLLEPSCRETNQAILSIIQAIEWLKSRTPKSYEPRPDLQEIAAQLVGMERSEIVESMKQLENGIYL